MNIKEIYLEACKALAEEDYQEALQLYNQVLEAEPCNESCLTILAQVYIQLEKYKEALEMAKRALKLTPSNPGIHLKKGIAEYHMREYTQARDSFEQALAFKAGDSKLKDWLQKCSKMIPVEVPVSSSKPSATPSSTPSSSAQSSTPSTTPSSSTPSSTPSSSAPSSTPSSSEPSSSLLSSSPLPTESAGSKDVPKVPEDAKKTRYDWYQTETHVIVTLLIKNISADNFKYTLTTKWLSCTINLPTGSTYTQEWCLQHQVIPEHSSIKIFSTKIEIKMQKEEGVRWSALESFENNIPNKSAAGEDSSTKKKPSSSHYTKDWDKLAHQIQEDKEEGDAELNQLFQQIYSDGSDETRKAMMKSFSESGGTVLSTNWKDIGEKKVEVKAPDGMEYKKWGY